VENKLRNAIAETTKFLWRGMAWRGSAWRGMDEFNGKKGRRGDAGTEWRVAQRLLEPLQMCRKRFGPRTKAPHASVGGIRGRLPTVRGFPCELRADCVAVYERNIRTPSAIVHHQAFRMIYRAVN